MSVSSSYIASCFIVTPFCFYSFSIIQSLKSVFGRWFVVLSSQHEVFVGLAKEKRRLWQVVHTQTACGLPLTCRLILVAALEGDGLVGLDLSLLRESLVLPDRDLDRA